MFWGNNIDVWCYVDSYHGSDRDNKRGITWYVFTVGETIVSWVLKLQKIVVLSLTKVEYGAELLLKEVRNLFGLSSWWVNWVLTEVYIVIVRMQFILAGTQYFIHRLSIFTLSVVSFDPCWRMAIWNWWRLRVVKIYWYVDKIGGQSKLLFNFDLFMLNVKDWIEHDQWKAWYIKVRNYGVSNRSPSGRFL